MKNLYVCEKCGKTFTNSGEAWNCEDSHCNVDILCPWDLPYDCGLPITTYDEGIPYPKYIVLKGAVKDTDGELVTKTMPNGSIHYVHEAVCYMRVDKTPKDFPNLTEYTNGMLTRAITDNRKEDEEG